MLYCIISNKSSNLVNIGSLGELNLLGFIVSNNL
jgi:hypothetical protein